MTKPELLEILINHYKVNGRWMDTIDIPPAAVKDYFKNIDEANKAAKRLLIYRNKNRTPCSIELISFKDGGMTKCYHQTQCCMESGCKIVVQRKSKFNLSVLKTGR